MKTEEWKTYIKNIVNEKDEDALMLLATFIEESEKAKQVLRNKGYGWTGLSLLKTVIEEVPENE